MFLKVCSVNFVDLWGTLTPLTYSSSPSGNTLRLSSEKKTYHSRIRSFGFCGGAKDAGFISIAI